MYFSPGTVVTDPLTNTNTEKTFFSETPATLENITYYYHYINHHSPVDKNDDNIIDMFNVRFLQLKKRFKCEKLFHYYTIIIF